MRYDMVGSSQWHPGLGRIDNLMPDQEAESESMLSTNSVEIIGASSLSVPTVINVGQVVESNMSVYAPSGCYDAPGFSWHAGRRALVARGICAQQVIANKDLPMRRAIEQIQAMALTRFAGAQVEVTAYRDADEDWTKLLFRVHLPESMKEDAFELEEAFLDEVCAKDDFDAALRGLIIRVR